MTTNSPARYTVRFPTSSIIIFASCHILLTAITSKNDTAGTRLEYGFDISDKASGRGLNSQYERYGYLTFCLKKFRNNPILRCPAVGTYETLSQSGLLRTEPALGPGQRA